MTILYTWDGEAMVPMRRFMRACDKQFVIGEMYPLVVQEERSQQTHRHFFASIREAWKNLPEDIADRFPSPEHLRKWCLIKCGYADERSIVCDTAKDADKFAVFLAHKNDHGVIVVKRNVVSLYTAKSQSMKAMGKKDFQKSKQDVLDQIASMIGVTPGTLEANAA